MYLSFSSIFANDPQSKGCGEKTWTFENYSDETVSKATNMLKGWYITISLERCGQ